jgi:hypothetical protein
MTATGPAVTLQRPPDCDDITMAATSDLAAARIQRRKVPGGLINEHDGQHDHHWPAVKSQVKRYGEVMAPYRPRAISS